MADLQSEEIEELLKEEKIKHPNRLVGRCLHNDTSHNSYSIPDIYIYILSSMSYLP